MSQYEVKVGQDLSEINPPGVDLVGDLHGCVSELFALITKLGYVLDTSGPEPGCQRIYHPQGRKLVLLGDITDRGPYNVDSLRAAQEIVAGGGEVLMGNHCNKLWRALKGNPVTMSHGLQGTWEELKEVSPEEKESFKEFLGARPHHVLIEVDDAPPIVAAHAGMPYSLLGRDGNAIRQHCMYGESTSGGPGEFPIRTYSWVSSWEHGEDRPWLVHGHDVTSDCNPMVYMGGQAINIDTGCVFGGKLTALRYPEMEFVSIPAFKFYYGDL